MIYRLEPGRGLTSNITRFYNKMKARDGPHLNLGRPSHRDLDILALATLLSGAGEDFGAI